MYKHFIFSLIVSILPSLCLAENPRITRLMREKQAKMEQLEKCMGSSKGLKIAGISTLGLTAVGVAGNIAEAKVIQEYDSKIEKTDKNIEKTKAEIQEKRDALAEKEEAEAKRIAAEEQAKRESRILRKVALEDIARINNGGFNGDKAVSHGYMPDRLPDSLRKQFADAMVNFIIRCRTLIGQYGIADVSLTPAEQERWGQYSGSSYLAEDTILEDLNEHLLAECKIIKCNETTHTFVYDGYGTRCDAKTSVVDSESDDKTTAAQPVENNAENLKKGLAQQTASGNEQKPDGTDCITEAKQKDSDAKTAKYKNGVCKITECSNPSKHPSNNGQTCVVRQASQWTDMEKRVRPDEYCNLAYSSDESKACCIEIYKNNNATSWDETKKECVCNKGSAWKNNKCAINFMWTGDTTTPNFGYGLTNPTQLTQTTPKADVKPIQTGPKDYGNKTIFYSRVNPKYQGCYKNDGYARAEVDGKVYEYTKTGVRFGSEVTKQETLNGLREKLNKDYKNYILTENTNPC